MTQTQKTNTVASHYVKIKSCKNKNEAGYFREITIGTVKPAGQPMGNSGHVTRNPTMSLNADAIRQAFKDGDVAEGSQWINFEMSPNRNYAGVNDPFAGQAPQADATQQTIPAQAATTAPVAEQKNTDNIPF